MVEVLALLLGQLDAHLELVRSPELPHRQRPEERVAQLHADVLRGQAQATTLGSEAEVELAFPAAEAVTHIPRVGVGLEPLHERTACLLEHVDVVGADIHADVLAMAARAALGLKRDLIDALEITDLGAPELDDLLGRHVPLVRRAHDDLDVDEVATSHVRLDAIRHEMEEAQQRVEAQATEGGA